MANDKKSGFHYLGIGCLIFGILFVIGASIFGFGAFRWFRDTEESIRNPERREQRVLELLGGDSLPEGYNAMIGVSIPLVLETVILTDQEPQHDDQPPNLGRQGLIYLSIRNFGRDREELDDFFTGVSDDPEALRRHDIDLELEERVASGTIERDRGPILWVSHRGRMVSGQTQGQHDGLVTLLQVHCPDDKRNRLGIWFGPEAEATDGEAADLSGSIADPAQVEWFVGHFRFCPVG